VLVALKFPFLEFRDLSDADAGGRKEYFVSVSQIVDPSLDLFTVNTF